MQGGFRKNLEAQHPPGTEQRVGQIDLTELHDFFAFDKTALGVGRLIAHGINAIETRIGLPAADNPVVKIETRFGIELHKLGIRHPACGIQVLCIVVEQAGKSSVGPVTAFCPGHSDSLRRQHQIHTPFTRVKMQFGLGPGRFQIETGSLFSKPRGGDQTCMLLECLIGTQPSILIKQDLDLAAGTAIYRQSDC